MSDTLENFLVILILLVTWIPIILFIKRIKKTKGSFNKNAILLCVFTAIFSGPIGLIIALIIINKNSNKFINEPKNNKNIVFNSNENIVFNSDDLYLNTTLDIAFEFMQEYLSSGINRVFTLFIFVDYVTNSFYTDEYVTVEILLNDWYPNVVLDKKILKSFTDHFKYDATKEKFYSEKILAKMNSRGRKTSSVAHLIQNFADNYETKNSHIKFEKTSYGVRFSKTSEEYSKEKDIYPVEIKRKNINHYFYHPKVLKMVEFIKEGGEPYKIIVNYDCLEIYYPDGTRKFDFLANKIESFEKVVSHDYKYNTSSIFYLGKAINKHFNNIYTVEENTKIFKVVYNEYEKDYGTELLNVELRISTETLEI